MKLFQIKKTIFFVCFLVFVFPILYSLEKKTTVVGGKLEIFELSSADFDSGKARKIRVWLPNTYFDNETTNYEFPVFYMHDGQNLFDNVTSYLGEWQIDETILSLINKNHYGSIVVGIDNGEGRFDEYSPDIKIDEKYKSFFSSSKADQYSYFIVNTVKPFIDSKYRTNKSREKTVVAGSSMGGIISLHMALTYPDVFGFAIVFSPAYHVYKMGEVRKYIKILCKKLKETSKISNPPNLYIYSGGNRAGDEPGAPWDEASIYNFMKKLKDYLKVFGYPKKSILFTENKNMSHSEWAWSVEFIKAYKWVFSL